MPGRKKKRNFSGGWSSKFSNCFWSFKNTVTEHDKQYKTESIKKIIETDHRDFRYWDFDFILFKKEPIRNSSIEKITNIENSMELFNIRWDTAKERLGKPDYKPERLKDRKWVKRGKRPREHCENVKHLWLEFQKERRENVAETILKEVTAENFC